MTTDATVSPEPAAAAQNADSALTLTDAAVRVGGRLLWHDVDIHVPPGQFVAILGPNVAGKSSLVKVALGLVPLAAGHAAVLGRPPGAANRQIGYLPQRRSFDRSVRVRGADLVRLGLDGDRFGLPLPWGAGARRARERVADVIDMVGGSRFANRPIGELSGGEQQRLLIAQALVRRPRVLILDEPLDSLDLPNQSAIAALIRRICVEAGVTVLMVAHDVNPILRYLDQVVYLAGGSAICGTPAEVITSANLSRLYGTPIEVLHTSDGGLVVVGQPEAPAHHADRHTGQLA
jgi:zinc/manganese transport system ATP-binding protein